MKSINELREHLKPKMKEVENGGFINPFTSNHGKEDEKGKLHPNIHPYRSRAVDEAMKFFTSKELGEERRAEILGKEWKNLT